VRVGRRAVCSNGHLKRRELAFAELAHKKVVGLA
jgi:hypothetical protein